jgi:peptide/nickel transport system permease protein
MLGYLLRRILWMIPTFFLISLVLFGLLSLAPGGGAQVAQESAGQQAMPASVKAFRAQFALDKPTFVNLRWRWAPEDVRAWVLAARADDMEARALLLDGGVDLVGPLVALLATEEDPALRRDIVNNLVLSAPLPSLPERNDPDRIQENRERVAFNNTFRDWGCAEDKPADCVETQAARWTAWWSEHAGRYTRSGAEAAVATVTDTRFGRYWANLLHFDFGVSIVSKRPVFDEMLRRVRVSMSLSLVSVLLAWMIAVPIGVWSAAKPGSPSDNVLSVVLFLLYSLPTFFTGTVLLAAFTLGSPWMIFPTGGLYDAGNPPVTTLGWIADVVWHLALPVTVSTVVSLAALSRYARAGVIEVIRADYIRTARAKGLSEPVVIVKHAVRNGMIPLLTLLGGILPVAVSGSVVVEYIFNIQGMGQFLLESIGQRDYNAVMASLLTASVLTLVGLLLSDLSYAVADPRIRLD